MRVRLALLCCLAAVPAIAQVEDPPPARAALDAGAIPGVARPELAWQHWVLKCQGCHREDGSGSQQTAPALAGFVARFTCVSGGRDYLARVPGVASAALSDSDLAELLNWTLWRFDRSHLAPSFKPYTARDVATLRRQPLRVEAPAVRADLIRRMRIQRGGSCAATE